MAEKPYTDPTPRAPEPLLSAAHARRLPSLGHERPPAVAPKVVLPPGVNRDQETRETEQTVAKRREVPVDVMSPDPVGHSFNVSSSLPPLLNGRVAAQHVLIPAESVF